jgi:thiomorpholine-carboxylate dehydrogenase
MIFIDDEAVLRTLLDWDDLIAVERDALIRFSRGNVIQPVRNLIEIEADRRYLGVMPVIEEHAMGLKLVSFYPGNAGTAVPTHTAIVLLFDTHTGVPLAVLDGRLITEMRTAAVSAAVTDRLAAQNAHVLTLVGSGVQARAHLEALQRVRRFSEIRVWSRTPEHARRFADDHGATALDLESAVRGADVIVTATNAREPLVKGRWLKSGAHVNAVGSPRPAWRELDDDAMAYALVVDSREAVLKESGDVILSGATILAEAGELFAGTIDVPASETTVFKSVGIAIEDLAAAALIHRRVTRDAAKHHATP